MASAQPQLRQKRMRPPAETTVRPEAVWGTLSPSLQAQIRQTLLRITQEVLHEPSHH